MRVIFRCLTLLVWVVVLASASGCGADEGVDAKKQSVNLLLDFTPNAVHSGIYLAVERGFDRDAGVRLKVRKTMSAGDSFKLLQSGGVDAALMDLNDLGIARSKGRDLVVVMAISQQPLDALLTVDSVRRPRELEGRYVGVTGLPSDSAIVRSIVGSEDGRAELVDEVVVGFGAVKALLAGRVSGVTGFWNTEGVALRRRGVRVREFRVDEYGAPRYPGLVLVVRRQTLQKERAVVERTVRALQRGYADVLADPAAGVHAMSAADGSLDELELRAQMRQVVRTFREREGKVGRLDHEVLTQWAAWAQRFGIVDRKLDVETAFDFELANTLR